MVRPTVALLREASAIEPSVTLAVPSPHTVGWVTVAYAAWRPSAWAGRT
jgi:hypothetical protein